MMRHALSISQINSTAAHATKKLLEFETLKPHIAVMKVALVTGASSGIGLLTSVELARAGYTVVATMRDLSRRQTLDTALQAAGASADIRTMDITKKDMISPLVQSVLRDHGSIDVLVNNAGFAMGGFAEDVSSDELREQFETNFFGHVAVTKAVLPAMRAQRAGHIVMMSSISGRSAPAGLSSYAASKFALEGWSESLRIELAPLGIWVSLVEPGAYATDIWHRNRKISEAAQSQASPNIERATRMRERIDRGLKMGDPQDVAKLVVKIASTPRPKLRYLIGQDAQIQFWLKTLLPWKTYERVVMRYLGI
jgi:NAD(P)-dependent dehydrogenase (short-subunit alcohol dehydrogenase family)